MFDAAVTFVAIVLLWCVAVAVVEAWYWLKDRKRERIEDSDYISERGIW